MYICRKLEEANHLTEFYWNQTLAIVKREEAEQGYEEDSDEENMN